MILLVYTFDQKRANAIGSLWPSRADFFSQSTTYQAGGGTLYHIVRTCVDPSFDNFDGMMSFKSTDDGATFSCTSRHVPSSCTLPHPGLYTSPCDNEEFEPLGKRTDANAFMEFSTCCDNTVVSTLMSLFRDRECWGAIPTVPKAKGWASDVDFHGPVWSQRRRQWHFEPSPPL